MEGPVSLFAWTGSRRGRIILGGWGLVFCGITGFSISERRRSRAAAARLEADAALADSPDSVTSSQSLLAASSSPDSFSASSKADAVASTARAKALLLRCLYRDRSVVIHGAVVLASLTARLWIQIKVSRQIGKLGSLLARRRWRALAHAQMRYAMWTVPAAVLNALADLSCTLLALAVQDVLMARVHRSYASRSGFSTVLQGVKDVDQRATSDVEQLADELARLFHASVKPVAETAILSATLARMMGVRPLLQCYLYFALAGTWTRLTTPSLMSSSSRVQAADGAFRSLHSKVKEFSEEVQFARGEAAEAAELQKMYAVLRSARASLGVQKFLSAVLDGYVVRYMGILVALGMLTPALSKLNKSEKVKDPTEFFLTCLHLLVSLMAAFKDVALAFRTAGTVKGLIRRVQPVLFPGAAASLSAANFDKFDPERLPERLSESASSSSALLDKSSAEPQGIPEKPETLAGVRKDAGEPSRCRLVDVDVSPPSAPGTMLFRGLSLEFRRGQSTFLRGPNGVGKTSAFRVLAGLWPPVRGHVELPADAVFLPQRAYVPSLSALRDQLWYPHHREKGRGAEEDAKLLEVLVLVGLAPRGARADVLDEEFRTESHSMSTGEMQRLACARVLVQRPSFALLDECTSSCTLDFQRTFLALCASRDITVVSVAHSNDTLDLHVRLVEIDCLGRVVKDTHPFSTL